MIPQTIHQVFIKFKDGRDLKQIPEFNDARKKLMRWCEKNKYIYKLWDEGEVYDLIREYYPQYEKLYNDFRFEIQKCDFVRYLILHRYGGIYLDLDMYPIRDMNGLFDQDYFFTRWHDDKQRLQTMEIYQKWTGRLVFQSTGHFMVHRVLKKNKVPEDKKLAIVSVYNPIKKICSIPPNDAGIFMDGSVSIWY